MALASGSVWVADPSKGQVLRLDPRTRAVEARIPVGGEAQVTAAGGAVWAFGPGRVLRIDPARDRVVEAISLPGAVPPGLVLDGRGGVWAGTSQALRRIDLRRNAVTRTVQTSRDAFMNIAGVSDGRILYIGRGDGRLLRFDAGSGRRLSAARAPFGQYLGVAGGVVFIGTDSGVSAFDSATGRTLWTRNLRAAQVNNGVVDGTTVWVQASDRATRRDRLWRLDARTGHVTGSLGLPEFGASGLVTVGKQVWTMSIGGDLQVALKKG
jgi:outer membrane protein assembly factor BamB